MRNDQVASKVADRMRSTPPDMPADPEAVRDTRCAAAQSRTYSGGSLLRIALGVTCLFGPLLSAAVLLALAPSAVEKQLVANYTREYAGLFEHGWSAVSPDSVRTALRTYPSRALIRTIALVHNSLRPALLVAGMAVLLSGAAHLLWSRRRYSAGRLALTLLAFVAIMAGVALLCRAPRPLYLVAVVTTVFVLNFPLADTLLDGAYPTGSPLLRALVALICLGAMTGISHLLAPVGVLAFTAWCLRPKSSMLTRLAVFLGRACTCLVSLPAVILAVYSSQPIPLSPQVRPLLEYRGLYDVAIDPPAGRLLATEAGGATAHITGETQCSVFVLSLNTLEVSNRFLVPSREIEDIELDPVRREVYHVDRATGKVLVLDADSFETRRTGQIPVPGGSGSTKLVLDLASNSLLVSFENDNLFLVDRDTLEATFLGTFGEVRFEADPANGLVYVNRVRDCEIAAVDVKTRETVHRTEAPERFARMVLAPKRRELYVTDPTAGTVRVYSTPQLQFLREIPAQFGVRAAAVDDDHGLLLAISVVTGYLDVIDLERGRRLARHYVGDYCRILRVDPATRRAFVTLTAKGLYVVDY